MTLRRREGGRERRPYEIYPPPAEHETEVKENKKKRAPIHGCAESVWIACSKGDQPIRGRDFRLEEKMPLIVPSEGKEGWQGVCVTGIDLAPGGTDTPAR